jgi:hypothetical protein
VVLVSLHFGWDLLEVEIPQGRRHETKPSGDDEELGPTPLTKTRKQSARKRKSILFWHHAVVDLLAQPGACSMLRKYILILLKSLEKEILFLVSRNLWRPCNVWVMLGTYSS